MNRSTEAKKNDTVKLTKSDAEWRKQLTPEQYYVTREHGTERAFSHPYWQEKRDGMYKCVACAPADNSALSEHEDRKFLMRRTEVRCANCEAHLGHVFTDGPKPTGQRYCINGCALELDTKDKSSG